MNAMPFDQRILKVANHNLAISVFGFGGAPLGNMHRVLSEAEAQETVQAAWDAGLRYFDTAPFYGHGLSESRLGAVLSQKPRDNYVLSTKVGRRLEPCTPGEEDSGIYLNPPPFRVRYDYSYDGVMRSYEDSLKRLGVDHIDILYVHDIGALTHGNQADHHFQTLLDSGWRALDNLRSSGAVRAIGLGVNENAVCEQILSAADPNIFLLAGRYTLLDHSAADHLLPRCIARGVGVVLGGPYNSGILATGPIANAQYDYAPASLDILSRATALQQICQVHGVSLAEAALHFPLRHPAILSVIPGSQTATQVALNVATFAKKPPEELWADMLSAGVIDQN
jgi:D-threo-aldose 1-dehydrogenase